MKMAGFVLKVLKCIFAVLIVSHVECVLKRSKEGCIICGRKSQPCNFQNADAYPKPWRISLLLEIVYGGWTLIR